MRKEYFLIIYIVLVVLAFTLGSSFLSEKVGFTQYVTACPDGSKVNFTESTLLVCGEANPLLSSYDHPQIQISEDYSIYI